LNSGAKKKPELSWPGPFPASILPDDAEVCDQADDRHHDQEREPLLVRHATPRGPRSSTT
jgi:hypothetical protein